MLSLCGSEATTLDAVQHRHHRFDDNPRFVNVMQRAEIPWEDAHCLHQVELGCLKGRDLFFDSEDGVEVALRTGVLAEISHPLDLLLRSELRKAVETVVLASRSRAAT